MTYPQSKNVLKGMAKQARAEVTEEGRSERGDAGAELM